MVSCDVLCLESELEEYDTDGVLCNLSRVRCWEDLVAKYQLAARDRPEQKWECPEDRKKAKDVLSRSAIIKANEFDFSMNDRDGQTGDKAAELALGVATNNRHGLHRERLL